MIALRVRIPFRSSLKPVGHVVFAKKSVKNSAACLVTKPVAVFFAVVTKVKIFKLASNITAQNGS